MPKPKATPSPSELSDLLHDIERYVTQYVSFPSLDFPFVAALYSAATYLWPSFDAFPYLVITSETKRSGKTRLAELLSFLVMNPFLLGGATGAAIFRLIRDGSPTLFIDEAETLSSEAATLMRAVLNLGYRKGQTIPRATLRGGVEQWPVYCPKVFVLIGDVYDTLRDRSIIVRMQRGHAPARFQFEAARSEGSSLGARIKRAVDAKSNDVLDAYALHGALDFLPDRDAEIWLPLFAVCQVFAPECIARLQRIAVDMATEKTAPERTYSTLGGAEDAAENHEYAVRLLRDLVAVAGDDRNLLTRDALDRLLALPTGPWRKFRGVGLSVHDVAALLDPFGVKPKHVRTRGGRMASTVGRGYAVAELRDAAVRSGAAGP